jgi:hypothetical protein
MEKPRLVKARRANKRLIRKYTVLRCPMVGHQASWCRQLCKPTQGKGVCGRTATHYMKDKFQVAIARYKKSHPAASEEQDA